MMKIGVVANEFFDRRLGRMGGFGWAARQVARCFNADPSLGDRVVLLTNDPHVLAYRSEALVHGARLLHIRPNRPEDLFRLESEQISLLLFIDYRPNYRFFAEALPHTPLIVWVRDPRTPEDMAKIGSLRLPDAPDTPPKGIMAVNCTSLGAVVQASRERGRPVLFASPAPHLITRIPGTYRVALDELHLLPNIIDIEPGEVTKSTHPQVVFLSRLDPIKRPWLMLELAQRFPDVEFLMLGQSHFQGQGGWMPSAVPANVHFLGHLGEAEKVRALASAWLLINTAIHEGLAISFLEALACETPILSCQDPGGVVSTFGAYVGQLDGAGLEGIPRFAEALGRLLRDHETRQQLGKEGRRWVEQTHSRTRFLEAFHAGCLRLGVSHHLA